MEKQVQSNPYANGFTNPNLFARTGGIFPNLLKKLMDSASQPMHEQYASAIERGFIDVLA
ncbi:MAG: hypothetical protein V1822_01575 [Candidatus Micrarchaeota archaeon]